LTGPPAKIPSLKGPIPSLTGPPSKPPPGKPPGKPPLLLTGGETKDISSLYRTKKIPVVFIPNILNTTKRAPGKNFDTHNFLGSSRVAEITGFRTIKADLTVGDKRTARLYDEDIFKTKRQISKSAKQTRNLLGGSKNIKKTTGKRKKKTKNVTRLI
jgi:hypothetical protein